MKPSCGATELSLILQRDMKYPDLSTIDSFSTTESSSMEESFDEVQAMKSALRFLVAMNADHKEIERFLVKHPEALLFEGTEMEDSAVGLIEKMALKCQCFFLGCNQNRMKIIQLLNRGFEHYRGVRVFHFPTDDTFFGRGGDWGFYSKQLRALKRDLREVKRKELVVRNRVVEARASVKFFRFQLESNSRKENANRSPLAALSCQRRTHLFERRHVLENKLATVTMAIVSLEEELELLNQERNAATRLQTALLKNAFTGCKRHVCEASRKEFD